MRAWIGCLASYNNGRLHGEWFDVSTDEDENAANIAKVLRTSPYPNTMKTDPESGEQYATAEEAFIADYDEAPGDLARLLGEYPGAATLADAARLIEALEEHFDDDEEAAAVLSAMLDGQSTAGLGQLADDAGDWISDNFAGRGDTLTAWCEEFLEDVGTLQAIPEELRRYFDYESYARDMRLGGDVYTAEVSGGVLVFWSR